MRIRIELSHNGIQRAIDEVRELKERYSRCELFVRRLAELGIPVIDHRIAASQGDSDKAHDTKITISSNGNDAVATLSVEGKDIVFIEFGAGVHYNTPAGTTPHPKGLEWGYTIGSYGWGNGILDYWYYTDDAGNKVRSEGTQATLPVYSAAKEMRENMIKIAKEVFMT